MADPWSAQVALPDAVEQLLQNICREQKQEPPGAEVRQKLASLGEEAALEILRKISASFNRKGLGGFILYMIDKASPQRLAPVFPLCTPSFASRLMFSPPQGNLRGSPSSSLSSEKLAAWGELEFRKAFLILSYIGENLLEDIDDISADEIRSLKHLGMLDFEERVWETLGKKYIDEEDRLMTLDWDAKKTTHLYHCHVSLDGKYRFKGPYLHETKTHLQRVLGDENVLAVKFAEEVAGRRIFSRDYYSIYQKIAREGIRVGSRRYCFFVFKDGGREERKKNSTTSPVKCFFIRMESNATIDQSEYILSRKTVNEARAVFMHAHGLSSVTSFMARFSLILSKTVKLEVDVASVNIEVIEDVLCRDRDGNIVYDKDDKPRILTDGTGFISEDLALLCSHDIYKGEQIRDENIERSSELDELAGKILAMMKQPKSQTRELFRLFNNGCAIKGTVLVNKKLPPRTIQVRPSMIKVWTDPKLTNIRTENSFEIVGTSRKPKRAFLSRYLIALLSYGGVPKEYFIEIVKNALRDGHGVFSDKRAALKVSIHHDDTDDFSAARMILSGIPLDESFLQHWLSILIKMEKRSLGQGKLPVPESYYLMGTADPTGILESDEVCVILDNGQISGKVLVYRNPGLHFGDIHVLKATYVKALESFVGNAKYAIFFSCKGPRSLADEIAGGDYDGDMYWVSRDPQLLKYYKGSEPWTPTSSMQNVPNHNVLNKKPSDFSAEKLEEELFKLFLTTRFQPSYAMSEAADSWLALMDQLLSLGENCIEEKDHVKAKILQLIDIYYDALDAPKKGGQKIEVPKELKAELFPHYMEREKSYTSTSILGLIYDKVESYQFEDPSMKEIRKLPCFDVKVPKACLNKWKEHYEQYRQEMANALRNGDHEGKNEVAEEVIQKYKKILYGAAEFEESKRGMKEIFSEALAIYNITYDFAKSRRSATWCGFAWRVAGPALLKYHAMKPGERSILFLPSVLRDTLCFFCRCFTGDP
ncbi:probable RNA-dependent RNA polymerase 3 isoform X2 [Corylus avellana]|uniref:probable RNA-dependent RNA polymerase 3 isoform X2 n=1 Tax=Corylus avellana TaxID=13451 RepID=UPI00286BE90A|nr:probable RNA-dependent RNA polymerase 3 isoform X2 [Corylus avellana]